MTRDTRSRYVVVIYRCWRNRCPLRRKFFVASIADVARCHMTGCFSASFNPVVTANTIASKSGVIDRCRYPGSRSVTHVTLFGGWNMICQFATGLHAIMTGTADAVHFSMVYTDNSEPSSR